MPREKRLNRINIYVTKNQQRYLEQIAEHDSTTTSELIRRAIDGYITMWAQHEAVKHKAFSEAQTKVHNPPPPGPLKQESPEPAQSATQNTPQVAKPTSQGPTPAEELRPGHMSIQEYTGG